MDEAQRDIQFLCDSAKGLAFCVEVGDLLDVFRNFQGVTDGLTNLLGFSAGLDEVEEGAAVFLDDFVDLDVGGVVVLLACAVFNLLDVAVVFVLGGEANGNGAVKEVDELGAAGRLYWDITW